MCRPAAALPSIADIRLESVKWPAYDPKQPFECSGILLAETNLIMPPRRIIYANVLVALSWLVLFGAACVVFVRHSLDHAAAVDDPEQYVHDPMFQVLSFLFAYGIPALLALVAALLITNRVLSPKLDD